jgi:hypothetical protein
MTLTTEQLAAHRHAIENLAKELALPRELVADRYQQQLAVLTQGAVITDYLVLLTSRHVRSDLRESEQART